MMRDLFQFLLDNMGRDPSLWALFILIAWIGASFLSRAFLITSRQSIAKDIEDQFFLSASNPIPLSTAFANSLHFNQPGTQTAEDGKPWSLAEVTRAYWLFKLTGLTMKLSVIAIFFAAIAILLFNQAGVRAEQGSLQPVIEKLGDFAICVLIVLLFLSGLKVQFALHMLPLPSLRNIRKSVTALLLW
jgi:hypothetical protein